MAAGLAAGAALVDYGTSRGDIMVMGAVTGLGVGALQALVLARSRVSGALWWAVANPPAWALCWLVTSYVITKNVQDQFTNFGASGAVLFGLLTWLLLAMLLRKPDPPVTR
jgi:CHASE2 domain-containing sensor protein